MNMLGLGLENLGVMEQQRKDLEASAKGSKMIMDALNMFTTIAAKENERLLREESKKQQESRSYYNGYTR